MVSCRFSSSFLECIANSSRGVPRHAPMSADGLIDYDTMRIRSFFGFNTDEIDTCCR
ncbi:MAG: hypothetical protein ACI9EQ_000532, partial [Bacteroidia bacterium]